MARLLIEVDIDVDPTLEDPHEVANELLADPLSSGGDMTEYAGNPTMFVGAQWKEDRG